MSTALSAVALAAGPRRRERALRPPRPPAAPGSSGSASRCSGSTTSRIRARNEAVVVLGQKKLLQRLGPGPDPRVHLLGLPRPLSDDRDGDDRRRRPRRDAPRGSAIRAGSRSSSTSSAVLVLVGVASAFWIRKVQRPRGFKGSHLGEADLILGLIAMIVLTLLLWHASLIATGMNEWPAAASPVSNAIAQVFGERRLGRRARAHPRLVAPPDRARLPRLPAALEAPPHRHRRDQRLVRPHPRRAAGSSRSTSPCPTRARCASAPTRSPT